MFVCTISVVSRSVCCQLSRTIVAPNVCMQKPGEPSFCRAGGCVVCCGVRCSATYTDVQFVNCSVVTVHSAKVTLNNCSFSWEGSTPASEVAIFASGSNTSVQVNGGVVNGARQGGTVCKGARFQADLWRISKEVLKGDCTFDCLRATPGTAARVSQLRADRPNA